LSICDLTSAYYRIGILRFQAETFTETTLVEAHHHWLRRRALNLESSCYDPATGQVTDQKQLALYLRYQTTHDRGFHKALNDLLKLKPSRGRSKLASNRRSVCKRNTT
jgi:hypothetical protein